MLHVSRDAFKSSKCTGSQQLAILSIITVPFAFNFLMKFLKMLK